MSRITAIIAALLTTHPAALSDITLRILDASNFLAVGLGLHGLAAFKCHM